MTDHTPPTDAELDAMQARADAATPGPWNIDRFNETLAVEVENMVVVDCVRGDFVPAWDWKNCAFIAAARSDVPRLIAEVRRLRALTEWRPKWRHRKRGSEYAEIGIAELQNSTGPVLTDGDAMMVYRAQDGSLWVRAIREFMDGRFESLPAPPADKKDGTP